MLQSVTFVTAHCNISIWQEKIRFIEIYSIKRIEIPFTPLIDRFLAEIGTFLVSQGLPWFHRAFTLHHSE